MRAMVPMRTAQNLKLRAEAQFAAAEATLGSAISAEAKQQAERAKAQALAKMAEMQVQWDDAQADLQPKLDAATSAREAAVAAETARGAAARGGAPGRARTRADIGVDQPEDSATLYPPSIQAHFR